MPSRMTVDLALVFHQTCFYQQMGHLHDYNAEILGRKCFPQKALANVRVHNHYILAYHPTSSKTLVPLGALGLCMFLYSSMTLSAPVPSINIGHGSPPRFNVVDISHDGLSLCLFNISPFLYILAYEYVGIKCKSCFFCHYR